MSNTNRHLFELTTNTISFKMKFNSCYSCFNQDSIFRVSEEKHLFSLIPFSMGFSFIDFFKLKMVFTKPTLS